MGGTVDSRLETSLGNDQREFPWTCRYWAGETDGWPVATGSSSFLSWLSETWQ